jgi:hypothetical protein
LKPQLKVVRSDDPAPPSPTPNNNYDDWVEDIRGITWNAFVKGRMTLEDIAAKASLSAKTVENFAWGDTKRPQAKTVFSIAVAVDFRMALMPASAPRQPNEPDLSEFRKDIKRRG